MIDTYGNKIHLYQSRLNRTVFSMGYSKMKQITKLPIFYLFYYSGTVTHVFGIS